MVRLGIVGFNDSLNELVSALRHTNDYTITGIYSLQDKELKGLTTKLMVQPVVIPEKLFSATDVLVVISDPAEYYDFLIRCIQSSKHLFLAGIGNLSLKQIENLIKLADEAQVIIYLPKILEWEKINIINQLVQQPLYIEVSSLKKYSGGANHSLDELKFLSVRAIEVFSVMNSSQALKIQSSASAVFCDYLDFVNARIDFANGCVGIFTAGLFAHKDEFKMKIFQRNEIIEMDFINEKLTKTLFGKNKSAATTKFSSGKNAQVKLLFNLRQFHEMILNSRNTIYSLVQSYSTILLTMKIFEKSKIPGFPDKQI